MTDHEIASLAAGIERLAQIKADLAAEPGTLPETLLDREALIAQAFAALPAGAQSAAERIILDGLDLAIAEARRALREAVGG